MGFGVCFRVWFLGFCLGDWCALWFEGFGCFALWACLWDLSRFGVVFDSVVCGVGFLCWVVSSFGFDSFV